MLAGVALAGGRSTRMGQDKSLLSRPNQDTTLLTQCKELLAALGQIQVWVSGGQHEQGIADIYPNCGPMSGIHGMLSYFSINEPEITEVLFVPVDMPGLRDIDLQCIVDQGRKSNSLCCYESHYFPLYIPVQSTFLSYLEQQLSTSLKQETRGKDKQFSIRHVLSKFSAKQIPVSNQSSLININTPLQWQQHCEALRIKGI